MNYQINSNPYEILAMQLEKVLTEIEVLNDLLKYYFSNNNNE